MVLLLKHVQVLGLNRTGRKLVEKARQSEQKRDLAGSRSTSQTNHFFMHGVAHTHTNIHRYIMKFYVCSGTKRSYVEFNVLSVDHRHPRLTEAFFTVSLFKRDLSRFSVAHWPDRQHTQTNNFEAHKTPHSTTQSFFICILKQDNIWIADQDHTINLPTKPSQ